LQHLACLAGLEPGLFGQRHQRFGIEDRSPLAEVRTIQTIQHRRFAFACFRKVHQSMRVECVAGDAIRREPIDQTVLPGRPHHLFVHLRHLFLGQVVLRHQHLPAVHRHVLRLARIELKRSMPD
jgi:hypothetical protein